MVLIGLRLLACPGGAGVACAQVEAVGADGNGVGGREGENVEEDGVALEAGGKFFPSLSGVGGAQDRAEVADGEAVGGIGEVDGVERGAGGDRDLAPGRALVVGDEDVAAFAAGDEALVAGRRDGEEEGFDGERGGLGGGVLAEGVGGQGVRGGRGGCRGCRSRRSRERRHDQRNQEGAARQRPYEETEGRRSRERRYGGEVHGVGKLSAGLRHGGWRGRSPGRCA